MHPAPSLIEAPPTHNGDESLTPPTNPAQRRDSPRLSASPPLNPLRKDTTSSISTQATSASGASNMSTETNNTSYSAETSPNLHQSIFSIKDGSDVSNNRRASRRRTGPLSREQREKAALIRKLGACNDCRRRRVACHPGHHNMTWEDAMRKYSRHDEPLRIDLAPIRTAAEIGQSVTQTSPLTSDKPMFTQDPQEMDIDSGTPTLPNGRSSSMSDSRIRTPLPSGPRPDKLSLPGIDHFKTGELQASISKMLSTPGRSRYSEAQVLLFYWQDDDSCVQAAVRDLADVLDSNYRYTFKIQPIPSSSEGCKSPWRWLSRTMTDFVEDHDQRDVLKIVYYNGQSYLDSNREMVLASPRDKERASTIRWSGIQQILETACSDTLIIMDAPYFPSSKMVRQQGVMELLAAAVSEEHFRALDRCTFTRALTDLLRTRAGQSWPLSAAEVHAKLLSSFPALIQDRHPQDTITSFPSPLHLQTSGSSRLPSILLGPIHPSYMRNGLPYSQEMPGSQINLCIRLASEDAVDVESWIEWLRMMPDGVKEVKVDGPYRAYR